MTVEPQSPQEFDDRPQKIGEDFAPRVIARPDPALPLVEATLVGLDEPPSSAPAAPPASPTAQPAHHGHTDWMGPARCGHMGIAAQRAHHARALLACFFALTPNGDEFETQKNRARALIAPLNPEERALLWPLLDWLKAIVLWDRVPDVSHPAPETETR